uniref:Uncharacterized protein n=1 Tax=Sporisorium reilianum TaxID=72558 RepID=Q4A3F5_9BASI|nr:hypothetical protein [Sporisorium reilianum]
MKATTPTDQQFYDALSPDLKRQVDAHRLAAQRKAAYAEQLKGKGARRFGARVGRRCQG